MAEQTTQAATDPVSIIQGMLDREAGVQAAPEQEQQTETPETSQPETEQVEAETNQQVEGDDAPSDAKVAEIPLDQLEAIQLEVEVAGEAGKVVEKPTIKELKLGYMRNKDYAIKTRELAKSRDEVGAKIREGIEGERTSYIQSLQQLQASLIESVAPEFKNVNWNDLATNQPAEYVRLRNRADQVQQTIKSINEKQQEAVTKQRADQTQALQKAAKEAREVLESDIPGWNDTLYQTLMKAGETYGFKPDEVGSWVDARSIKVLHDAYQFRQLKATAPDTKKVVNVPKVIKPGATSVASQRQRNTDSAMQKLGKSGRIEDAAAVIRARLG